MSIITNPAHIEALRLNMLRRALRLEINTGMKRSNSGRPTGVIIREVMGSKTRDKVKLLAEYEAWLAEQGILSAR